MKKVKQRNNHARSRRRIKLLKLKNFCKRVMENRAAKIAKLKKPKGKTLVGQAAKQIPLCIKISKEFLHAERD